MEHYYRCLRYNQHGYDECSPHRITLKTLTVVVLEDIRNNARLEKEDEEAFVQRLHKVSLKEKNSDIEKKRKREAVIQNRFVEIDMLVQKPFEKNVSGILPNNMLSNLLKGYEQERITLDAELFEIRNGLLKFEGQTTDISKEIENLKQHAKITELNRKIVTNLIQAVYISEPKKDGKQKVYDIEIRYKFQNHFAASMGIEKEETSSANEVSSENHNAAN